VAQPATVDGKPTRLGAHFLEVVGRPTGSTNKPYMIWKIREAQKGRIPVGLRKNAHREGVTFKVLPLRLEAAVVDASTSSSSGPRTQRRCLQTLPLRECSCIHA
jgi:hypothetical protein